MTFRTLNSSNFGGHCWPGKKVKGTCDTELDSRHIWGFLKTFEKPDNPTNETVFHVRDIPSEVHNIIIFISSWAVPLFLVLLLLKIAADEERK